MNLYDFDAHRQRKLAEKAAAACDVTFGSVCSGIEAASVAWEPLGWRASWFAEIEKFPSAVLAHRFPNVPNLGDMTAIAAAVRAHLVHAPDVLVGGTPCQAFSVAGARLGLEDPRGQLTLAYVDLANAIDESRQSLGKQPSVIVWENVPGVLSDKGNAFGCFLGALAGEDCELQPAGKRWANAGCVFGPQRAIAWRVLDAQYFGVAQRRRRVFVVASARQGFDPTTVLFESEGLRRDTAPRREAWEGPAAGTLRSTDGGSDVDHARAGHLQPVVCMAHGQAGAEIAEGRSPTLTCNHEAPIVVHGTQDPCVSQDTAFTLGRNQGQENVLAFTCKDYGADVGHLSPTLRAMGHGGSHANAGGQVAVSYLVTDDVTGTLSARQSGGGGLGTDFDLAGGLQPAHTVCITGDITHTLKAEGFDASEDGTGRGQPIVAVEGRDARVVAFAENSRAEVRLENGDGSICGALTRGGGKAGQGTPTVKVGRAVRRLIPKECERLQGFPDDWTIVPYNGKPAERCADGPRYKALGNSMAVPCMGFIGRRLHPYLTGVNFGSAALAA